MTPEAQRIAIAIACGLSREAIDKRLDWELADQQSQWGQISTEEYYRRHLRVDPTPAPIPHYLDDLNAMHEAEALLSGTKMARYCEVLANGPHDPFIIHATAAQRAEAFLRTLNLWETAQ